jgi:transcriptional regulator with XRE-family HTH domain
MQVNSSILLVLGNHKMSSFGEKLRNWRKMKWMTQKDLAAAVGLGPAYISNLERGFSTSSPTKAPQPSEPVVAKLSKVLDVPLDTIRVAAGYAPIDSGEEIEVFEGVRIKFQNSANWTEEERAKAVDSVRVVLAGQRALKDKKNEQ